MAANRRKKSIPTPPITPAHTTQHTTPTPPITPPHTTHHTTPTPPITPLCTGGKFQCSSNRVMEISRDRFSRISEHILCNTEIHAQIHSITKFSRLLGM